MLDKPLLVFGEILWDIFPDGKKLGGAPLNFSYYFRKQGGNPQLISAIGKDKLGEDALKQIKYLGINTSYIQQIDKPTGEVNIFLKNGYHKFRINRGTAWENISYPEEELAKCASGLYFGTVSRISEHNRSTLDKLISNLKDKTIFLDLNLREKFYNASDVGSLIRRVNYLKLNEEEAYFLKKMGLLQGTYEEEMVDFLIRMYKLNSCCITLGQNGVVGGNKEGIFRVGGIPIGKLGDSVGCGDAFSATWLACLLKRIPIKESLEKANEIAAKVASKRGAIVEI